MGITVLATSVFTTDFDGHFPSVICITEGIFIFINGLCPSLIHVFVVVAFK